MPYSHHDISLGFNYNWTEEDALMLIENGLQERVETCRWVSNGLFCNMHVKGRDFSVHLRDIHGVTGTPASQHRCCWSGCRERDFNRDCLIRHLKEQHLYWRWPCSYCRQDFTRKNTLIEHHNSLQYPVGNLEFSLSVVGKVGVPQCLTSTATALGNTGLGKFGVHISTQRVVKRQMPSNRSSNTFSRFRPSNITSTQGSLE
ncbi:hypothetical protein V8B97DRAFT_2108835 [Scleroderma yunnanense]